MPELTHTDGYAAAFATSDEHLSLALEQTSYELHYLLDQHLSSAPSIDGEPPVEDPNRQRLLALAAFSRRELAYRKQQNNPSIGSSKRNYENLVYRRNTLENHMTSVLYLSTRHKPDSTITRELLLSAAAGLAMIFATAVAIASTGITFAVDFQHTGFYAVGTNFDRTRYEFELRQGFTLEPCCNYCRHNLHCRSAQLVPAWA